MFRGRDCPTHDQTLGRPALVALAAACFVLACASISSGCGQGYKNSPQAAIDEANNFLTIGDCDSAINVLKPVYDSSSVNNDIRMTYSSAYACKGGLFMTSVISSLASASSDIWSALVKSDYSSGSSDGHLTNLNTASDVLRTTASSSPGFNASDRSNDANTFMIFLQAEIIGSVISPLGLANQSTGHKTQSIATAIANGQVTSSDECYVEVAVATIDDCLTYVSAGTALGNVSNEVSTVCGTLAGGCPTNKDYSACSVTDLNDGKLLLEAIDADWSF